MPCSNSAVCNQITPPISPFFTCTCAVSESVAGYTGQLCDVDIEECKVKDTVSGTHGKCVNFSECEETSPDIPSNSPFYECYCIPGFKGLHCEININECLEQVFTDDSAETIADAGSPVVHSKLCLNDATCIEIPVNVFQPITKHLSNDPNYRVVLLKFLFWVKVSFWLKK